MTDPRMTPTNDAPVTVTVELNECPPGLFTYNGTLCFKSEYTTTLESPRRYQCDAYVVASGEYFHGGAANSIARGLLQVTPVPAALTSAPSSFLEPYDAGLLGDGGGGDVDWWQDYIRAELERAHEFYSDQVMGVRA